MKRFFTAESAEIAERSRLIDRARSALLNPRHQNALRAEITLAAISAISALSAVKTSTSQPAVPA
jgi:hypothetical protein